MSGGQIIRPSGARLILPSGARAIHDPNAEPCCEGSSLPCQHCDPYPTPRAYRATIIGVTLDWSCIYDGLMRHSYEITGVTGSPNGVFTLTQHPNASCSWRAQIESSAYTVTNSSYEGEGCIDYDGKVTYDFYNLQFSHTTSFPGGKHMPYFLAYLGSSPQMREMDVFRSSLVDDEAEDWEGCTNYALTSVYERRHTGGSVILEPIL